MNDWQAKVRAFHRDVLKQPHSPAEPKLRNPMLRARLVLEEAVETAVALVGKDRACQLLDVYAGCLKTMSVSNEPDLVEAIDGCIDTIVVCLGTLEDIGVDGDPFFDEVHRSNMAKVGGPVDEHGKQHKPPGWTPPDIAGVLTRMIAHRGRERESLIKALDDAYAAHCQRGMLPDRESFRRRALQGLFESEVPPMSESEFDEWAASRQWAMVTALFHERAQAGEPWRMIDGSGSVEDVSREVWRMVEALIGGDSECPRCGFEICACLGGRRR